MHNLTFTKIKLIAFAILFGSLLSAYGQTPVAKYGQLKIFNGKVSDSNGNPVVLRGMSLFWSGYPEGSPFYNAATIKELRDNWCVDVVRAALSVETGNTNYLGNASGEYSKIKTVIDACIANGLYVVVDFHSHNAPNYLSQAKTFFTAIANEYKNVPNVLYEPYNEPISQDWGSVIKPYHNEIIKTIRAIDPDNIIICGTKNYSQDVDIAANDQVTGTNIAYTLHYYANSHQGSLRQKATNALSKGVALFVTEYGTTNASGNGGYNSSESQVWWDFLEANKLSSCNWSVSNKGETSAILNPGTNAVSGWTASQITTSGALVKNYLKSKCNVTVQSGSITISFPGNKVQYNKGEAVVINAAATTSSGTIAKLEFYSDNILIGSDLTSPYSFSTTTLAGGGHNITAKSFGANGNLIGVSPLYTINVVGASNVSTTGVTDQFETVDQYSELTGAVNGPSCATATLAAATGVYWFDDKDPATPFSATYTRAGDGKLKYVITQAANAYNVVGFNFGEYCDGVVKKKYSLNLSANSVLKLTVETPSTNITTLDLKIQMKDADGTVLAINKAVVRTDGTIDKTKDSDWYLYEIGFSKNHSAPDFVSLIPGSKVNFEFDFKNALSVNNPNAPSLPNDINNNNADFDFKNVTEVVIIPVNSEATPDYAPKAFTNQQIIFSGLTLGNPAAGVDLCSTPPAVQTENSTYCEGATNAAEVLAKGIAGLKLQWYTAATGGVAGLDAPIPSTSVSGVTKYYVSQATGNTPVCEGSRKEVSVNVVAAPVSDAGSDQINASGPNISLTGTGSAVGTWSVVAPAGAAVTFAPGAGAASVTANGATKLGDYTFKYSVAGTAPCAAATSSVLVRVTTINGLNDSRYLSENVEIYPNPATDNLVVNLNKVIGSKSMKLLDMFGRVVFESSNETSVNVDMSTLTKGMYIVQIQSEAGKLSRTIIKQ